MKIVVSARSERGFRRMGKFWPATETVVDVTPEEYKTLKDERALIVVDVEKASKASTKKGE